jgi:16S rRNA (adenine1518-N6/adenine1519-N6)-dimethyltransferase
MMIGVVTGASDPVSTEIFLSESQHALLRKYGIRPVKRRGQNFLVDGNLARAIAQDTLAVSDRVLELGAGGGALTVHLLAGASRVVCVEVDRHLCGLLRTEYGQREGFQLIEADLAKLDWSAAVSAAGEFPVIAGNLPYVLTSKVLFALADLRKVIRGGVFMVQKEVAERLVAPPGGRDYGILAVILGSVFQVGIIRKVSPSVFWPRPEVDSAIVRLLPGRDWPQEDLDQFVSVVKTLFGQRRKKLGTLLRGQFALDAKAVAELTDQAGVDADSRPEQIDPAGFQRLAEALSRKDKG